MRIIRAHNQPLVPWKNGTGVTRELLIGGRPGAPFDWRISLATIAKDGPFSIFSGYDRTLIVLDGHGSLAIGDRLEPLRPAAAVRFVGDQPASATVDDALTVLNIMSRTGPWRHHVRMCGLAAAAASQAEVVRLFAVLEPGLSDLRRGDLIEGPGDARALGDIGGLEISIGPNDSD